MYSGYATWAGIELFNTERLAAYLTNGLGGGHFRMPAGCDCQALTASFTDPGPYTLPDTATFEAPWYDPARPESAHFAGILVEQIVGLDGPYASREVNQAVIGGALGGLRLGPRTITVECLLIGLSTLSLDYGLAWLTAVLSGRFCNAQTFCHLGDLTFFAGCPDPTQASECVGTGVTVLDETALDLQRTMFSGGLVDGPRVTNRMNRGGEVLAYEVTFTIAMESPYLAGATELFVDDVDLTANPSVATEVYTCPGFVDPCAGLPPASGVATSCVTFVEDTCDFNEGNERGPASWLTQTWTPTGEEVIAADPGVPCSMVLTRSGDAGLPPFCERPAVRLNFGDALGGVGPISVEFDLTTTQGNVLINLWNPATDQNVPITGFTSPSGSQAHTWASPTGDSYNLLNPTSIGHHQIFFDLPTGVDPGSLYLIISAFGGGGTGNPIDETLSGIFMNFLGTAQPACCSLEPGDPIVTATFQVPCYSVPTASHRTITSVTNPDLVTERGLKYQVVNADPGTPIQNMRIAVYDPTLIGLLPTALPTVGGVWPGGGVQEWECNALVHELFVPEVPAGTTIEIDGCRRQNLRYANGLPAEAVSGDRFVYGGPERPYTFQSVPPCTTYAVVVFADDTNTPAGSLIDIGAADLHLVDGAAA